jgi:hypothetical protein
MKFLFFFTGLFLTGCSGMPIHPKFLANIELACKDHGGWVEINTWYRGIAARCHDGTEVSHGTIDK